MGDNKIESLNYSMRRGGRAGGGDRQVRGRGREGGRNGGKESERMMSAERKEERESGMEGGRKQGGKDGRQEKKMCQHLKKGGNVTGKSPI